MNMLGIANSSTGAADYNILGGAEFASTLQDFDKVDGFEKLVSYITSPRTLHRLKEIKLEKR